MIVHPVGHKAIAIDAREQVFRRAVVTAAANAKRQQHYQHQKFKPDVHRELWA
jgi:hypothetical protein